jgi:tetratricopeptide (TPR) repeat protein/beta-lactamase regulating signal transducer with metallopeptidase domain
MVNADLLSVANTFVLSMANHLWQSTLFAGAAWLITMFLKKNRARIRYWIWFSVSIKFLIPFSLIVNLGGWIAPEWMKAPIEIPPEWNVIQTINQPFNSLNLKEASPTLDITASPNPSNKIPLIIFSLWLCGGSAILLDRHKRGMRLFRMVRKAELLTDSHTAQVFHRNKQENRISNTVQLASTQDMIEPSVFGIFRHVLLLPAGIIERVNDSELEAIFLHEFAHIRYKDNLIAFIHMLVEALFWFHPVVWWTGSRLVFERERACDESVLRSGKNPLAYAKGILKVCEYHLRAPLVCVSGIIGANLKRRIEGIVQNKPVRKLSLSKKILLSIAGLTVLGIPLSIGMINAPSSQIHSSNSDLKKRYVDEYKPEKYQVSDKPERKIGPSEKIKVKDNQSIPSAVHSDALTQEVQSFSDDKATGTGVTVEQASDNFKEGSDALLTLQGKKSNKPIMENNNPAIGMTQTKIQAIKSSEDKMKSFEEVRETALYADAEESIVPAQREAPVKASSDAVHVPKTSSVELKTESPDAYISRGVSYLKKGRIEDAISGFNKAINLDPERAVAYFARGSAYHRLDQLDNAISDYNKAIEINPDLAVAYQNRGSVYNRLGRFEYAISDYNKAIEINPDFIVAYQDRGVVYQNQGKFDSAISDYSKALEMNPEDAVAFTRRGTAYFSQEQYQKAFEDFNRAIELNPRYANAYINRGACYHITENYDSAIADYKKALELDPETAFRKRLKEYLRYVKEMDKGSEKAIIV